MQEGNLLIHSGDATFQGRPQELEFFSAALKEWIPNFDKIIFVPGNHDILFQSNPGLARSLIPEDVVVLVDEAYQYDKYLIYGTPWTSYWLNYCWAFQCPAPELKKVWEKVPESTDILITHNPPYLLGDKVGNRMEGCPRLRERLEDEEDTRFNKVKLHVFGHIHESYGVYGFGQGRIAVNASSCNESCQAVNAPVIVNI